VCPMRFFSVLCFIVSSLLERERAPSLDVDWRVTRFGSFYDVSDLAFAPPFFKFHGLGLLRAIFAGRVPKRIVARPEMPSCFLQVFFEQ